MTIAGTPFPGTGFAGVVLRAGWQTTTTNADGTYTLMVEYGWSGSLMPEYPCYTFSPDRVNYTNLNRDQWNVNFSASPSTYTISGTISVGGSGLSGVTVSADNGGGSGTTNASGNYSVTVSCGWSGMVTPSHAGHTFSPPNRSYTNVRFNQTYQNYTATLISRMISGTITSGGSGLSGVTVSANNGGGSGTTDGSGNYSLTVFYGWSGTVTPSRTGYTFSPPNRSYTNVTGNQTGQNYTATLNTYTISGTITSGGSRLSGVAVSANNGGGSATTNASGNYSLTVSYGWSGTVIPSRTGYTFSPPNRAYTNVTFNQTGHDYMGTPIPYTISGRITSGGSGLSGVTVSANNGGGSGTTDGSGSYSLTVWYGWSGVVTPSRTGHTFSPPNRSYTNVTSNQTGQDYTATPSPYTISGRITSGASGLSGVTVSANNGGGSGTTDGSGNYSVTISYAWSGAVTPTSTCYTFSPASRPYTNVTSNQTVQNYTATQRTYTICGRITHNGAALPGVSVSANNGGNSVSTDGSGNYCVTVPCGWSGTVTAAHDCYTFSPASRSYANVTSNQTGESYTAEQRTCEIWGVITHNGDPLPDVSVSADNGGGSDSTVWDGSYCVTVPCGWSGTITATHDCYTFWPTPATYTNVASDQTWQNFTATQRTCEIWGRILSSTGASMPRILVSADNGGPSVLVGPFGGGVQGVSYSMWVPCGWTGTVTPSLADYTFSPPSLSLSDVTSNQKLQDFTALPNTIEIQVHVFTAGGTPVGGVTVTANNGGGSGTTSSTGFCVVRVPYGWTGAVTPSRADYTFSPSSRSFSNTAFHQVNQDFTARPNTLSISGSVLTSGGTPVAGVTVTANDGGSGTTDSSGRYSLNLPYGWTGAMTPSHADYTFSPSSRSFSSLTSSQVCQHFTAASQEAVMTPEESTSAELVTRVTFIWLLERDLSPEERNKNLEDIALDANDVVDAIEIPASEGKVVDAAPEMSRIPPSALGMLRIASPEVEVNEHSFRYLLEYEKISGRKKHHRVRNVRANYLALRKLKAGRYVIRYRVEILREKRVIQQTSFSPAAVFTIRR